MFEAIRRLAQKSHAVPLALSLLLSCVLSSGPSTAQSTQKPQHVKLNTPKDQHIRLRGRVVAGDSGHGNGVIESIDLGQFTNVVEIGGAGEGDVFITCDPNQRQLITSDHPDLLFITKRGNVTDVSLVPWAAPIHITVRTDALSLGASGTYTFRVKAKKLAVLEASFSGTCTVTGDGDIGCVEFGGAGNNNRFIGTGFNIDNCIIWASGDCSADVAPRNSLFAHGPGTVRVKSHSKPSYFRQTGPGDVQVKFI